jgi:arylsulfatase A-like enzyme
MTHLKKSRYLVVLSAIIVITAALVTVILIQSGPSADSGERFPLRTTLQDYNLIIINIDSLRADHLGCYGYHRKTSPFIDRLAKQGIVFENALSNSSFTRESVSVLMTGRLPSSGGSTGWSAIPSPRIKKMGELFNTAGYRTALFSNTNIINHPQFLNGFNETFLLKKWGVSGQGSKLSQRAGDFIQKNSKKKFFIYLHYLDPHGPYNPSPRFYKKFSNTPFEKPLSLYKYIRFHTPELESEGFGPGEPRFEDLVLRYDAEIAMVDDAVKELFKTLKENNVDQRTLLIITADHGEEFLEHHFIEHAWTLYNESLHIPLIFWAPGQLKPGRIPSRVSTVDLLPTLLELTKTPHQRKDFDGTILFKKQGNTYHFNPPTKPFIAELLIQHRNMVRTVIKDNWKYIASRKWLKPEERLKGDSNLPEFEKKRKLHLRNWGPVVVEELYDLSTDAGEKQNVISQFKIKHRLLKNLLVKYRHYCLTSGLKNTPGKDKEKKLSKDEIEKLKELGYL